MALKNMRLCFWVLKDQYNSLLCNANGFLYGALNTLKAEHTMCLPSGTCCNSSTSHNGPWPYTDSCQKFTVQYIERKVRSYTATCTMLLSQHSASLCLATYLPLLPWYLSTSPYISEVSPPFYTWGTETEKLSGLSKVTQEACD